MMTMQYLFLYINSPASSLLFISPSTQHQPDLLVYVLLSEEEKDFSTI